MFHRNGFAILLTCSVFTALPAFSQEESYRSEVSAQAFGSFVTTTWQDGVKQKANDSGGVLANYGFLFNKNNALDFNYGYSLNTQVYASPTSALGVKSYSHEATAAYVARLPFNRWSLFGLAGTGALIFQPDNVRGVGYQARAVAVYGVGVDVDISTRWFLRAQYRGLIYDSPTYSLPALAGMDRVTQRFEPSIGFGRRF